MSDTPRTDEANCRHTKELAYENYYSVSVDFARTLERENASLKEENDQLKSEVERLKVENEELRGNVIGVYMGYHVSEIKNIPLRVRCAWKQGQKLYTQEIKEAHNDL